MSEIANRFFYALRIIKIPLNDRRFVLSVLLPFKIPDLNCTRSLSTAYVTKSQETAGDEPIAQETSQ
jgi:hypothetical protein